MDNSLQSTETTIIHDRVPFLPVLPALDEVSALVECEGHESQTVGVTDHALQPSDEYAGAYGVGEC